MVRFIADPNSLKGFGGAPAVGTDFDVDTAGLTTNDIGFADVSIPDGDDVQTAGEITIAALGDITFGGAGHHRARRR